MPKKIILLLTFTGLSFRAHALDESHRIMQSIFAGLVCAISAVSPFLFENANPISLLGGTIISILVGASAVRVNILKARQIKKDLDNDQ